MQEKELVRPVCTFLRSEFDCNKVLTEVEFLKKRIDIVGKRGRRIFAVELKVNDWMRALIQAQADQLCAHKVYVALPHSTIHRVDRTLFSNLHIGLLEVNGGVELVEDAKESSLIQTQSLREVGNDPRWGRN